VGRSTDSLQIGFQHGEIAKKEVLGSLAFSTAYYQRKAKMDWPTVSINAEKFVPVLEKDWPEFIEEMKGKPHEKSKSP
jgi:isopenicillin-N N-acyltransferase-like protein